MTVKYIDEPCYHVSWLFSVNMLSMNLDITSGLHVDFRRISSSK